MKELTKAEEQVMQKLWKLKKGFVKDIIEILPPPKPAYTTVSTIIRLLTQKEFVSYIAYGKTHQYFALISKEDYKKYKTQSLLKNYFQGSFKNLVSHFTEKQVIDIDELDEILLIIKQTKKRR